MDSLPLVGSISSGFGADSIMAPTRNTPNLEQSSKDFVGMLYAYMFQQMRESGSDEEEGLFSGAHTNMLMGILDQEVGKKMAHAEGKGLADALFGQFGGKQDAFIRPGTEPALFAPDGVDSGAATLAAGNQVLGEELAGDLMSDLEDPSRQIMDELYKLNVQE